MYISQIKVDDTLKSAKRALSSPQIMHAIIENCFETSEVKLWRIDDENLLIVSTRPPSNLQVAEQLSKDPPVSKDYEPHLYTLSNEKIYRFRLTANPVHSVPTEHGKRGKVLAHVTIDQQMDWLRSKADKIGVVFNEYTITASEFIKFQKNGNDVTLKLATYNGYLTVKDSSLLTKAMITGIGRAKAYGAGLLTLMS
jgi:CRISPR system Cascade subunit CasE